MNETISRINEVIVELNTALTKISDNDTVEFDVENRLNVLEVAADDLNTDVDSTIELLEQTSG